MNGFPWRRDRMRPGEARLREVRLLPSGRQEHHLTDDDGRRSARCRASPASAELPSVTPPGADAAALSDARAVSSWLPRPPCPGASHPCPTPRRHATRPCPGRQRHPSLARVPTSPSPHPRRRHRPPPASAPHPRPPLRLPRRGWKSGKPGRGGRSGPTLELCQGLRAGCLLWTTTRSSGS